MVCHACHTTDKEVFVTRSRPQCCFVGRRVNSPAKNMIIFTDILLNGALRAPLKRCTAGAPRGRQGTRVFRRTSRCPLLYVLANSPMYTCRLQKSHRATELAMCCSQMLQSKLPPHHPDTARLFHTSSVRLSLSRTLIYHGGFHGESSVPIWVAVGANPWML